MCLNARNYAREIGTLFAIMKQRLFEKKKIFQGLTPFITGKKKISSTKPHIEKILRAKPEMVGSVWFCYSSGNLTGLGAELGPPPVPHLLQEEPAIVTGETKQDPHRHPRSFPFPRHWEFCSYLLQGCPIFGKTAFRRSMGPQTRRQLCH